MANEFKHFSIGGELTQAEYEAVGGHVLESQAIGDIIYATSTSQLSRLGIGSTGAVLTVTGGVPAWDTTWTPTGHLIPASDDSYDLGSSTAAWQDLFLEGDISLTDAGSISTAAGALTIGSAAAINITPTAGSAILLDGTISIDAGVVTGATSITSTAFAGALTGNVTGNASGTAATVTSGTQAAITTLANLVEVGALDDGSITSGFTSIDVGSGAITTTGALSIGSMGTNWTNAGRTVADMGIVTTIDINGGTIDGTVIGGTTAAAITGAAVTGTSIVGGTVAGTTAAFSGLITANGGITFAAGDDIAFTGGTGTNDIVLANGLADALSITDGSADVIAISTAGGTNTVAITGDLTVSGTIAADTAAVATAVTITDNENENESNAIIFGAGGDVDGGNIGLESDGTLTYNPSTGKITATGFVGALTGNADTATALATTRAIAVAGDVTGTANFDGSAAISITTTLATDAIVTANITNANVTLAKMAVESVDSNQYVDGSIDTAHIGDNQITLAKMAGIARGKIIYGDASGDPAVLASGSANQVLTMTDGDDFDWADSTVGDITSIVAGTGLTGSNLTSGDATLNVIGGTGITANANDIAVDAAQTQITSIGTIGTGVWQGTAIASGYIAGDAITGAKIADDAIDSEHYTDGSIDNAHIADDAIDSEHYADGSIDNAHIADDAIDSEHYAAGSIDTAHIADNQVTLAKMAGGTDGNIISYDASGDPVAVATGTDGQVLTSAGAGAPPAFEDAGGGTFDSLYKTVIEGNAAAGGIKAWVMVSPPNGNPADGDVLDGASVVADGYGSRGPDNYSTLRGGGWRFADHSSNSADSDHGISGDWLGHNDTTGGVMVARIVWPHHADVSGACFARKGSAESGADENNFQGFRKITTGNVFAVCDSGGTETTRDTSTTGVLQVGYRVEQFWESGAKVMRFYAGGSQVGADVTTNTHAASMDWFIGFRSDETTTNACVMNMSDITTWRKENV